MNAFHAGRLGVFALALLGGAFPSMAVDDPLAAADSPVSDAPLTVVETLANPSDEPVRIAITVESWLEYQGASAGPREDQTCILRENVPGQDRLDVLVSAEVFDRLAALGIADPKGHFVQKSIVVTGIVHTNPTPFGNVSHILWVENLDQIESITAIEAE
jgi:hypothetical protein